MVDGGGLENRFPERGRGFESYSLRQKICGAKFTCNGQHVTICIPPQTEELKLRVIGYWYPAAGGDHGEVTELA